MATDTRLPVPAAGTLVREEFGATQIEQRSELTSNSLAAREMAIIHSMHVMALQNRRSIPKFESEILAECERPSFAEIARFARPVGKQWNAEKQEEEEVVAEGWSIRFAEAAKRCFMNVYDEAIVVYEDDEQRIVRMTVEDLQTNNHYVNQFVFKKRVERKFAGDREVLGERLNSRSKKIYVVRATDDELQNKQAAQWSKFQRNVLRLMPGDILDKCLVQVQKTLKGLSPEAARDRIVMAFDQIGVTVSDLQEYFGHAMSGITSVEIDDLRKTYAAIKEGEIGWKTVMETRQSDRRGSSDDTKRVAAEKIAKNLGYTVEQVLDCIDAKDVAAALRAKYPKEQAKPEQTAKSDDGSFNEARENAIKAMAAETGYSVNQVAEFIDSRSFKIDIEAKYGPAPKGKQEQKSEPEPSNAGQKGWNFGG